MHSLTNTFKQALLGTLIVLLSGTVLAQNNVGIGTTTPDSSAVLDVSSIDKGILIPRLTTIQRTAIANPTVGLLVFDTDTEAFWFLETSGWKELRKGNITSLEDDDGDTRIQVEQSPDEDVIRFAVDNAEVFRIRRNVGGRTMLELPGSGGHSTFLGWLAGDASTTGVSNSYLGSLAGFLNSTGNNNVFVGRQAGRNSSGSQNVFVGRDAGYHTFGDYNVLVGFNAGYSELGSHKLYIANSATPSPLIYGEFDNSWLKVNGRLTPTEGITDADGDTRIQVEESPDEDIIRLDVAGTEALKIRKNSGGETMVELPDNSSSTYFGLNAGQASTTGVQNTFIGQSAGQSTTNGTGNTTVGTNAGRDNISGNFNTYVGFNTGRNSTGTDNTFVGKQAGFNAVGDDNVFLGKMAGSNEPGSHKLYIANSSTSFPLIYGEFDNQVVGIHGSLGIGTSSPTKAKVEIDGDEGQTETSYGYLHSNGTTGTSSATTGYSLWASYKIAALEVHAVSDRRIKHIKGVSDSRHDLQTLMGIEVTDYTLIDTISKGNDQHKKVIAQQLAEVYPQAVTSDITEVIPDIYQRAQVVDGWIQLATDLQPGERVKIITEQASEVYEVLAAEPRRFKVNELETLNLKPETVFIYGREVNDFHTVDYEAIAMLNVSATQELADRIVQLETENAGMQSRITSLEAMVMNLAQLKSSDEAQQHDSMKPGTQIQ